ncbi:MAG: flagellar basal body rod protein FlgC [Cyanobacteria bacterium P01_H01_bin.74]
MPLTSAFHIASEALTAQSERMKVHAHNIANINTPFYQRKVPILLEKNTMDFQSILTGFQNGMLKTGISTAPGGVELAGTVLDNTAGRRLYQPGHPQADKDGFITLSNVSPMIDMADAMQTSRLYEANLAVIGVVKNMANKALEIGRG